MDLQEESNHLSKMAMRLQHVEQTLATEKQAVLLAQAQVDACEAAQEILQLVAQAIQQAAHENISAVVSKCLKTVFRNPYEFVIEFERKRGRTEANLRFKRNGHTIDPISASGGGVIDVAAFALRVSCLMLARPRVRRFISLDEPFKFVSAQYRDNVRQMLEELSKELKLQILCITHIDELETGQIIRL